MNIVFLQDDFLPEAKGGAATVSATLAGELFRRGHQVTIITTTRDALKAGVSEWEGITVHRIFSAYHPRWRAYVSLHNRQVMPTLKFLLRNLHPDVVHVHNVHQYLSYAAISLAKKEGARVIMTAHDTMLFDYGKTIKHPTLFSLLWRYRFRVNPFRQIFVKRALQDVDVLVAVSQTLADALGYHGFAAEVVHNGIDTEDWQLQKPQPANKSILFGGRVSELKGSKVALAMLQEVQKEIPEATLIVAGTAQLKGAHNVGWLSGEALKKTYAESTVVVTPSLYMDPLIMINIEAMAMGKPVVASCHGGGKEAILDGETGYVVDPHDTRVFAQRVLRLLKDSELATRMGAAGRIRVEKEFSARHMTDQYESLYSKEKGVSTRIEV